MKRFLKYVGAFIAGVAMIACSEDYLDVKPTSAVDGETMTSDIENYGLYINGINQLMVTQQSTFGQGYCGMSDVLVDIGNSCGNDWSAERFGGYNSANMKLNVNNQAAYSQYAWWFFYQIIGQANRILAQIDTAAGEDESARAFYKAQALTYRAYCYQYLVQIFSKRWMDSNNGASDGVILRLTDSTDEMPVSTLAQCYQQIYQDCDDAIRLYEESGRSNKYFYEPGINMAYGVKARAAAAREDWETAATNAAYAYDGYDLMSERDFQDGFCESNSEWIYGGYGSSAENMWYYTFGTYYGYNAYYSAAAGYNVLGNRELVDKLNDTDIRKKLFFAQSWFPQYDFDAYINQGYIGSYLQVHTSMQRVFWAYMHSLEGPAKRYGQTSYYPTKPCIYGQLKFAVFDLPGVSNMCWMRAAEFYLLEAEALCKQATPDYTKAQELLYTINSARDASYEKSTKTAQDLIDEIMFYRRAELWGEGHDWFDLKRTGASISRKSYKNNGGGTFGSQFAVTVGPNDPGTNDWVWVIPLIETQYNDMIE